MKNKISIIVPIYNVEEYIGKCIQSLVNQKYDNYEILLIDDGSTDKSSVIAKKYEKKYPKLVKYFYKTNGGLSDARNFGITKSTGKYIMFVDSDDYISENTLQYLTKYLNNDIIVFGFTIIRNNISENVCPFDNSINDLAKKFICSLPSACNKLFKKELFEKNKIYFPLNLYYEDLATTPLLVLYTNKIYFLDIPLYYYVQRNASIMNKKSYNPKMDSIFSVLEILRNSFKEKYEKEIEYLHIENLLWSASLRYIDCNKNEYIKKINSIMKDNYPNWKKNIYYKKYSFKKKIVCYLIYNNYLKTLNFLRKI